MKEWESSRRVYGIKIIIVAIFFFFWEYNLPYYFKINIKFEVKVEAFVLLNLMRMYIGFLFSVTSYHKLGA